MQFIARYLDRTNDKKSITFSKVSEFKDQMKALGTTAGDYQIGVVRKPDDLIVYHISKHVILDATTVTSFVKFAKDFRQLNEEDQLKILFAANAEWIKIDIKEPKFKNYLKGLTLLEEDIEAYAKRHAQEGAFGLISENILDYVDMDAIYELIRNDWSYVTEGFHKPKSYMLERQK